MKYVRCNLCKSNDYEIKFKIKRYGKNFTIVKCKNCKLVYLNPRLTLKDQKKYYNKYYNYGAFLKNKKGIIQRAKDDMEFLRKFKKHGNFLEIGCMHGFLLEIARRKKFNIYGIDVTKKVVDYARNELNLPVYYGTIISRKFQNNFFDLVYLSHVIEHVNDPLGDLIEINRILKKNGCIALKCPNFNSIMSLLANKNWWWIAPPEHLYHFTPHSIKIMLKKAGFKDIDIKSNHGDLNYLRYLSIPIINILPISNKSKIMYRNKLDNNVDHISKKFFLRLYNFLNPITKLIHKSLLGEELIVVAKK